MTLNAKDELISDSLFGAFNFQKKKEKKREKKNTNFCSRIRKKKFNQTIKGPF